MRRSAMRRLSFTFVALLLSAGTAAVESPPAVATVDKLVVTDRVVGRGIEAKPGMTLTMHYTGWLYDAKAANGHGKQFDSTRGRKPFSFTMGDPRLKPGWSRGIVGMRVGGRRELLIPAALGYGSRGAGDGVIPPDAALVFDVELLDASQSPGSAP